MALLDVEKMVPEVYVEESRDFQLMCRLFTFLFTSVKNDVDSMLNITNTKFCRENALKLLQTKLGFFTGTQVSDEELRYVLQAFPTIVKYKGSLRAVQMTIATFLKAKHLNAEYAVQYFTNEEDAEESGLKPFTIGISINASIVQAELLQAILKYVLPAGFNLQIYFYNEMNALTRFISRNKAKLLFVTNELNSQLRAANYEEDYKWDEYRHSTDMENNGIAISEDYGDEVSDSRYIDEVGEYYVDILLNGADTMQVVSPQDLANITINRYKFDNYVQNNVLKIHVISNVLNSYLTSTKEMTRYDQLGYIPADVDTPVPTETLARDSIQIMGGYIPRYDQTRRHAMTYYSEVDPTVDPRATEEWQRIYNRPVDHVVPKNIVINYNDIE